MNLKTVNIQVDNRVMKTEFTQQMIIDVQNIKPFDYIDEEELQRLIRLEQRKKKLEKIKENINKM